MGSLIRPNEGRGPVNDRRVPEDVLNPPAQLGVGSPLPKLSSCNFQACRRMG